MGKPVSKPAVVEGDEFVEQSTGTHVFELHMPSSGAGILTLLLISGAIAAAVYTWYTFHKNRGHRGRRDPYARAESGLSRSFRYSGEDQLPYWQQPAPCKCGSAQRAPQMAPPAVPAFRPSSRITEVFEVDGGQTAVVNIAPSGPLVPSRLSATPLQL
jgi:hypothetical protein